MDKFDELDITIKRKDHKEKDDLQLLKYHQAMIVSNRFVLVLGILLILMAFSLYFTFSAINNNYVEFISLLILGIVLTLVFIMIFFVTRGIISGAKEELDRREKVKQMEL